MSDEDTRPDTLKAILEMAARAVNEGIKCNQAVHDLRSAVQSDIYALEARLEKRFRSLEDRIAVLEGRKLAPGPD